MAHIDSVELQGHGNSPRPKSFKKTIRRIRQFSNNRFAGQIKENWLILHGSGMTELIQSLTLRMEIGGVPVPTHVIEIAAESNSLLHVWFAAYTDLRALTEADEVKELEELESAIAPKRPVVGIGAITVTITTSSGSTSGTGDVDEEVP